MEKIDYYISICKKIYVKICLLVYFYIISFWSVFKIVFFFRKKWNWKSPKRAAKNIAIPHLIRNQSFRFFHKNLIEIRSKKHNKIYCSIYCIVKSDGKTISTFANFFQKSNVRQKSEFLLKRWIFDKKNNFGYKSLCFVKNHFLRGWLFFQNLKNNLFSLRISIKFLSKELWFWIICWVVIFATLLSNFFSPKFRFF